MPASATAVMARWVDAPRPGRVAMTGIGEVASAANVRLLAARETLLRYLRARGAADEAEDIVQDMWLRLQALGPGVADVGTPYLLRMAHNLLVDRHRARVRREAREGSFQALLAPDAAPSTGAAMDARDLLDRADRTLAALGPRTDRIFRRHRVDCVAQRDVAAELGISLSAVEKHLQKAYRALAALAREARS